MHFVGVMSLGRATVSTDSTVSPDALPPVVAITCAEGSPYRQIVIEVDDPQATADRLRTQPASR